MIGFLTQLTASLVIDILLGNSFRINSAHVFKFYYYIAEQSSGFVFHVAVILIICHERNDFIFTSH